MRHAEPVARAEPVITSGYVSVDDPNATHPLLSEPIYEGYVRRAHLSLPPGRYRGVLWHPDHTTEPGWITVCAASSYFTPRPVRRGGLA